MGTLTLHDAPHVNYDNLKRARPHRRRTGQDRSSLPGQFELGFAFSGWSLGAETCNRLNIPEAEWQAPGFNLLQQLGFTRKQIDEANDVICGRGTVEGAPHLKRRALPRLRLRQQMRQARHSVTSPPMATSA